MTAQPSLFEGERRKREGIRRAVIHRPELAAKAQRTAVMLAEANGTVTAEELRVALKVLGEREEEMRWILGSVFADKTKWERIGDDYTIHPKGHHRRIGRYALRGPR